MLKKKYAIIIFVGYDDKCDATMTQEMATAAFRFGHTLIRNVFPRMNAKYQEETDGLDLKVCHCFLFPFD